MSKMVHENWTAGLGAGNTRTSLSASTGGAMAAGYSGASATKSANTLLAFPLSPTPPTNAANSVNVRSSAQAVSNQTVASVSGLSNSSTRGSSSSTTSCSSTNSSSSTGPSISSTPWFSVTFSFTDANPPVTLPNPGTQNRAAGAIVALSVSATDSTSTSLTYYANNLPVGLDIDHTTGLISGTIDNEAAEYNNGSYPVTIIVVDANGLSAQQSFTWNISPTILPLVFANPGDQSNTQGDDVWLAVDATSPEYNALTYSAVGLPSGLQIDSDSGVIYGTLPTNPGAATTAPASVTVTATDAARCSQPARLLTGPCWPIKSRQYLRRRETKTTSAATAFTLPVQAFDPDNNPLTYTATGLPSGLILDANSGTISGHIDASAVSATPYAVTLPASNWQASASQTFNWSVDAVGVSNPYDQANVIGDT